MAKKLILSSILASCLTLIIPAAHAEILISQITGYSKLRNFISNTPNASLEILGGFVGPDCPNGTKDSNSTCNTCAFTNQQAAACGTFTPTPCNETRAYPELQLKITYTSTSLQPGTIYTPRIETADALNVTSITPISISPQTVNGPNQAVTMVLTWSQICSAYNIADSGSVSSGDKALCKIPIGEALQQFRIGFVASGNLSDSGNDSTPINIYVNTPEDTFDDIYAGNDPCTAGGLCNFSLRPGDAKAFIEANIQFTQPSPSTVQNLIFLCQTDSFTFDLCRDTGTVVARVPMAGMALGKDSFEGLSNGVEYFCQAAVEDLAGNIGIFVRRNNASCPDNSFSNQCHQVTPDEVIGLFSEKQNCFVATAAYGSFWDDHVQTLRDFRSRILLKSTLGRLLVKAYYEVSPPLAKWIAKSDDRRRYARYALTPLVWGASLVTYWSWTLVVGLLFGCCLLIFRRKLF